MVQDRVGNLVVGHPFVLNLVPGGGIIDHPAVAERLAEDLFEEVALQLGFRLGGELARLFQIGPFDEHRVSLSDFVIGKELTFGGILDGTGEKEGVGFRVPSGNLRDFLD